MHKLANKFKALVLKNANNKQIPVSLLLLAVFVDSRRLQASNTKTFITIISLL
jgi:hypothetical protein